MIDFAQISCSSLSVAAQMYATGGLAVFPCSMNKRPLTKQGFKNASTDSSQITRWWKQHPAASIGLPTGGKTFVLDVDQPDGPISLAKLEERYGCLPPTLEQHTGGNGRHLFFLMPPTTEVRNSAGKIGKGLDIRGKGGYVILPPSSHESGEVYRWTGTSQTPAEAPEWLISLISKPAALPCQAEQPPRLLNDPYLEKALSEELSRIRNSQQGARNEILNSASFAVGQLIHNGLNRNEVERALLDAAITSGLSEIEALKTIQSGLQAGEAKPRIPPNTALKKQSIAGKSSSNTETKEWPKPNKDMLHGLAGKFTSYATKDSEADPVAVLATFLCRFGAEVGRPPFFFAGNKQRCCLNTVLVGQSSKARKGTSAVPVQQLFTPSDSKWITPQISAGPLSSGEGLVYAIRDEQEEWKIDKNGEGKHVIIDPGTEDKRLFILDQEFAGALSCTKRDGNTLSTIIRSLFDGGKVEPLTKTNKIKVEKPHVCIVTHITLHELLRKLDDVEIFNGFANRFLWLCVRRSKFVPLPKPLDNNELEQFRDKLFTTVRFAQQQKELVFSSEAASLWNEIYPILAADRPDDLLGAILSRAETYTIRLALTYALLDQSKQVKIPHLRAALALWDYCEQSASYIFGNNAADPTERKILESLMASKSMDSRELYAVFANNISKKKIERAVSNLMGTGKIVVETAPKNPGPGRPKKIFRLNEQNELNEQTSLCERLNSFCSFDSSDPKEQAK